MAQSRFAQEGNKLSQLLGSISVEHNQPQLGEMADDAFIDFNANLKLRRNQLTDMLAGLVVKIDQLMISVDGPTLPPMGTPGAMDQAGPIVENAPTQRPDLRG